MRTASQTAMPIVTQLSHAASGASTNSESTRTAKVFCMFLHQKITSSKSMTHAAGGATWRTTSGLLRKERSARRCHAGVRLMSAQSHATKGYLILAWQATKASQRAVINVAQVSGITVAIRSASSLWTPQVSENIIKGIRRHLYLCTSVLLQDAILGKGSEI